MWHVSFRSGVATLRTATRLLLVTYILFSPVPLTFTSVLDSRYLANGRDPYACENHCRKSVGSKSGIHIGTDGHDRSRYLAH